MEGLIGIGIGAGLAFLASLYGAHNEQKREHQRWLRDRRLDAGMAVTIAVSESVTASTRLAELRRSEDVRSWTDEEIASIDHQVRAAIHGTHAAYALVRLVGSEAVQKPNYDILDHTLVMLGTDASPDEIVEAGRQLEVATNDFNAAAFDTLGIAE